MPAAPPTSSRAAFDRALLVFFVAGILFVGVVLGYRVWERPGKGQTMDFEHFYWAAQSMVAGKDIYHSGPRFEEIHQCGYIYPPLVAWIMTPIAGLSQDAASRIWFCVTFALFVTALAACFRGFAERIGAPTDRLTMAAAVFLAILINFDKVRAEFEMGQTDALVMLGFALGLMWLDKRPLLAGTALGLAFNVKYLSIVALPYLLIRRRWAAAGSMVVSTVLFGLLPATIVGWHTNLEYLRVAYGGLLQMSGLGGDTLSANIEPLAYFRSISLPSAGARVLGEHMSPVRLAALLGVVGAACAGTAWWMYRRCGVNMLVDRGGANEQMPANRAAVAVEWAAVVVVSLVFSPQTFARHTFLLAPVHVLAVILLVAPRRGVNLAWLIAGLIISALGVIFPPGETGWDESLAFWRFYGGASWCILAMFFALLWTTLKYAQASRAGAPLVMRPDEPLPASKPA